ncbi:DUF4232 domain-containing protein [Nocardioides KLBMP 9356]|uniref:DUF4232 domain-containing protein n=1 Tax=Nocardioides potassii TaxID=2911371 RepID=A0ABS9HFH1_9ACTN|nr:DUF4232 domain-containing protein [Nocardioides potassii]MCF6379078.1 DUF4232 domain-containing protein [Nocardioides potassii]
MVRSVWHRSLFLMLGACALAVVATLHLHPGAPQAQAGAPAGPSSSAATGASTRAVATAVPECGDADLTASYRARDAAAGHRYGVIRLTDTGDRTCVLQGYGGLSYVGGGNGAQVGAPADRDPGTAPRVVLHPGDRARSLVSEAVAQDYPRATCRPAPVDGFRVYLPDSTRSQLVAHATTGCRNSSVHLLSHEPFRG